MELTEALEAVGVLEDVDGAELLEDDGEEETLLPLEEEPLAGDDAEPCELPELLEPELLEPELLDPELAFPDPELELPDPEPEPEPPSGFTYC